VEENEEIDAKSVMEIYENYKKNIFPDLRVEYLHGKMKPKEKDAIMEEFNAGNIDILISTTVIEVGVNVPNSNIMIIENAERFGLAQLHQLRGRVGRGQEQSYCILRTKDELSQEGLFRINTMCATNNGFEIAQADLQLRGPGNIAGTQQSGVLDLKIADIVLDEPLMVQVKDLATQIISHDPLLKAEENKVLRHYLMLKHKTADFSQIS
ncbi:MAG: helicase-related protein, partial [Bacteroidales bacterium]|nr:helicase-related protein [Bacteroidales bacterium]